MYTFLPDFRTDIFHIRWIFTREKTKQDKEFYKRKKTLSNNLIILQLLSVLLSLLHALYCKVILARKTMIQDC